VNEDRRLDVLLDGQLVGLITMDSSGRLTFSYDELWRSSRSPTPLSLSMRLAQSEHGDAVVRPFLWGLLPDNERVLERWAQAYQVSARNPFALLRHVGEDCAGAIQLVRPDRVDSVLAGEGPVTWLDESGVAQRLRMLREDPTAWHLYEGGQFSLAGAQAKTALYRDPSTGRWGVPSGATPTTHILKPAIPGFDGHDLNEHLCLTAARTIGLSAAYTTVESFGPERAIVVQRYDRVIRDGKVYRVHQEDLCQALGVSPLTKYQQEGGPTPEQIIELLRMYAVPGIIAESTVERFADALALNWIVGGTDAHAKNYSVLLRGAQVRLSPLYDVASALPYDGLYAPKLKMAMRIGGEYGLLATSGRHWRRFAATNRLDPDALVNSIDGVAERLPEALAAAASSGEVKDLGSRLPARLVDVVAARAAQCRRQLLQ
jgi:serine/threonine-protein kinase HipA